jgi:hypothetical protein
MPLSKGISSPTIVTRETFIPRIYQEDEVYDEHERSGPAVHAPPFPSFPLQKGFLNYSSLFTLHSSLPSRHLPAHDKGGYNSL